VRQYHHDSDAAPTYQRPLTAQQLRRERVRLARELLVLVWDDLVSNAPDEVTCLVAGMLDALGTLQKLLAPRHLPW
jgi:hypothetical protein